MSYIIKHNPSTPHCINIYGRLIANQDGTLLVDFPQRWITNFGLNKSYSKVDDISSYRKKFYFEPNDKIDFNYELCEQNRVEDPYFPIVQSDFFQIIPLTGLVLPVMDPQDTINGHIKMENFPNHLKFFSSQGAMENNEAHFIVNIDEIGSFIITGSNQYKTFYIQNKPIHVVKKGDWNNNTINESKLVHAVKVQYEKMGSSKIPALLLLIKSNLAYFRANHFYNAFVLWNEPEVTTEKLIRAIAHEACHEWLGWSFLWEENDKLLWFFEGFNDQLSLQFALENQLISENAYIDEVNRLLRVYYFFSPKINSYEELYKKGQNDDYYERIILLRGNFVMLGLDNEPINLANNKMAHYLIRDLVEELIHTKEKLTEQQLDETFNNYYSFDMWKKIKNSMQDGTFILPKSLFNGKAILKNIEVDYPDLEMNMTAFFDHHTVENLQESSPAYKVGLRNGMQFHHYNIHFSDANKPTRIAIGQTIYDFNTKTLKRTIPQYQFING